MVAVVSASSPARFSPQHATEASAFVRPQVCAEPALMELNFSPPATGVGSARSVVVLSPTCPVLLFPQQYAVPSGDRAHECRLPLAMLLNWKLPATGAGA